MKPETAFRKNRVDPFIRTLKNCHSFSIQQVSIRDTPDKLICINGFFVAMEIKVDDEPRPGQQHQLDCVVRAGGISLVACPNNWEQVKIYLTYLDGLKEEDIWKPKKLK